MNMCEAVVLNQETGDRKDFKSMEDAETWAREKNNSLAWAGQAPRYAAYPVNELPEWYTSKQ